MTRLMIFSVMWLPGAVGILISEAFAIRSWIFHALNGAVSAWVGWQMFSAFGDSGLYGVSKAGIAGLTRSQAEAWSRHGVCVNTVIPGFVLTPLTAQAASDPERVKYLADRAMARRNGLPEDFRGAALFLASAASAYVTGQMLFVDGGFSVH